MKKLILSCVLVAAALTPALAKKVRVASPDGQIVVHVTDEKGTLDYTVSRAGKELYGQTALTLQLDTKTLGEKARINGSRVFADKKEIRPVVPIKHSVIQHHSNHLLLKMKGGYEVEFQVMDNAVAYRFVINEKDSVNILDESFNLRTAQPMTLHYQGTKSFMTSSENVYKHCNLAEWQGDEDMSTLPVLLQAQDGSDLHLLVCESDLRDYSGMFVKGTGDGGMVSTFPRYPLVWKRDGDRGSHFDKLADYFARTTGKRSLPWRYVAITDSKGLLEQTITTQLAGDVELQDTEWIKPGQVAWDWWNGKSIYGPDVQFKAGCNTATYKYFVDFAQRYGVEYIILDEGWEENVDTPFTPNNQLDLQELIRYGKEKGVGVILWLTWTSVKDNLDKMFGIYEQWGVAGVKIDFMDRSDQWMVNYYEDAVKEAAKHHILVDFHGAYKPAGLDVRYPNLLSYEGVRGMEQMGGCTPDNSLYIPFMRNAVGPADYTPGAMLSMQPEYYQTSSVNRASIGTRAYQLALYVVLESGIQMLSDAPTAYYKNDDCTRFISQVPVTWDETRAIQAISGELVAVAKRKGNQWFIGAICNNKERKREIEIPLDFLGQGTYQMTSFEDGFQADRQALDYARKERSVTGKEVLKVTLCRNGGFAAMLTAK